MIAATMAVAVATLWLLSVGGAADKEQFLLWLRLKEKRGVTGAETRVGSCRTFRYISRPDSRSLFIALPL